MKFTLPSLESRLVGYGTMSLAIAAVAAPNLSAGIVYSAPGLTTPVGGGIYFSLVSGSASTAASSSLAPGSAPGRFALENEVGSPSLLKAFVVGSAANKFAVSPSSGAFSNPSSAARLIRNTTIGAGLNFANYSGVANSLASNRSLSVALGHWNALGNGFLGLTFDIGPSTYYGWADITINPDYTVTLNSMAYEDAGNPIQAGQGSAPEPDSLLLMAMGAVGLAALRRRRAVKASVEPEPIDI